jgi:serine/threonine-protein kinase
VATSAASGALKPRTALLLLLGFLGFLAGGYALDRSMPGGFRLALADVLGVPYAPEALSFRVREDLSALGLKDPAGSEVSGFVYESRVIRWLEEPTTIRGEAIAAGRASAIRFSWSKGVPLPAERNPRVPPSIPDRPDLPPGSASLRLDTHGRLLRLVAAPDPKQELRPAHETVATLLKLAGLEPRLLAPAPPVGTPPVFADSRFSFEGAPPDVPSLELHVEIGTFCGAPVFFEVWGPWGPPGAGTTSAGFSMGDLALLLDALLLLAAAFFVRRNLAAGRADRVGAFRIFAFIALADFAAGLLRARHFAGTGEMRLVTNLAASALYAAATAWLFYVALEPHVRRLWPESLVSWTRLLSGRFRDPMVARDVLVGLFCYQAIGIGILAIVLPLRAASPSQLPIRVSLAPLSGGRFVLAALVDAPRNGVSLALLYLLVLLLVRTLVRRVKLAGLLLFSIFFVIALASLAILSGELGPAAIALALFSAAVWTAMITRLGFLSMVVLASVLDLAVSVPFTFDSSRWYFGVSLVVMAVLASLAVGSWWFARAPRALARA